MAAYVADRAAQAPYMRAGNCDEYAALTLLKLQPWLQPGERARLVGTVVGSHVWVKLHAPAPQAPGDAPGAASGDASAPAVTVVADAWSESPAILLQDSRLADVPGRQVYAEFGAEDAKPVRQLHVTRLAALTGTPPRAAETPL